MDSIDNDFFEEYKHLDKLCSDIFSVSNGISAYISRMEEDTDEGKRCVPTWTSDLKALKHVRWVRNQIAHDHSEYGFSKPEDCEYLYDFYKRIFDGKDPLAQLHRSKNKNTSRDSIGTDQQETADPSGIRQAQNDASIGFRDVLTVLVLAAISMAIWIAIANK